MGTNRTWVDSEAEANRVIPPFDNGTLNNFDVMCFATGTGIGREALPASWRGRFIEIHGTVEFDFATTERGVLASIVKGQVGSTQVGDTCRAGERLPWVVPPLTEDSLSPTVHFLHIASAAGFIKLVLKS